MERLKSQKDKIEKIQSFKKRILERADFEQIWQEIIEFSEKIKKNKENYLDCLAYHILIGSTPEKNNPKQFFDFEGEFSIINFINKLKEKYKIE